MIVRNFEYLLALDRERHFGRAAKSCNVSQPTLSSGIKQLEEDMDVLIVRRGQRFDGFTHEGLRVLVWAQQMLEDCQGLKQELSALRDKGVPVCFRLGVLPATSALAPILSVALAEKMPLLELSLITGDSASLLGSLRRNELDLALVYTEEVAEEGFETHVLYRERMFLFCSDSPNQPRRMDWDELVHLPLCLLRSAVPSVAQTHLKRAARTIETDSLDVLVAHLATGRYATVLPQSFAGRLLSVPKLQAVAVTGPGSQANVGFVMGKKDSTCAPAVSLMEMVHTPELVVPIRSLLAAHRSLRPREVTSGDSSQSSSAS